MITRLEFMACPCCAGHEMVGAAAAQHLSQAIDQYLKEHPLVDYIETELFNIRNAVINATEAGRAQALAYDPVEVRDDATGSAYTDDPLFD